MDPGDGVGVLQFHLVTNTPLFEKFMQHECYFDWSDRALVRNTNYHRDFAAFEIAQALEHTSRTLAGIRGL